MSRPRRWRLSLPILVPCLVGTLLLLGPAGSPLAAQAPDRAPDRAPDPAPDRAPDADTPCRQSFSGLSYRLEERDGPAVHPICPDTTTPVDVGSLLVLDFEPPAAPDSVEPGPEQQALLTALHEANEMARGLSEDYDRLNAADPDLDDPESVARIQDMVRAFDARFRRFTDALDRLGMDWVGIVSDNPDRPYQALGAALADEIERRDRELQRFVESRDRFELTVQAFHSPYGKAERAIHVEPYDSIPVGELQPLPKLGLQLSERERERLEQGLQLNEAAAELLRQSRNGFEGLRTTAGQLIDDLEGRLRRLGDALEELPSTWPDEVASAIEELRRMAEDDALSDETRQTIDRLADDLQGLTETLDGLSELRSSLDAIRDRLRSPSDATLGALLSGDDGLLGDLQSLDKTIRGLPDAVGDARERIERIGAAVRDLGDALGEDLARRLLPEEVRTALEELQEGVAGPLGDAIAMIDSLTGVLGPLSTSMAITRSLSETDVPSGARWFALADPPTARVNLRSVGWLPGEQLSVKVRFREVRADGSGEVRHQETYLLEATPMGWHRRVSSNLIFARALDADEPPAADEGGDGDGGDDGNGGDAADAAALDDAEDWKPNVAALVNWHYRFRDPTGGARRFWNGLDLGLGVHLASLDQTDDSVEFGLGVNIELWNGLFTAGYGYNLSRSNDSEYVFVGLDLFEVLNRGQRRQSIPPAPASP